MPIQATYKSGTCTVTSGSAVVTGQGTAWALALVNGGEFSSNGCSIPIASVQDDTHLTLDYPAPAAMAGAAQPYSIALGRADAADAIVAVRKLSDVADALSNKVSAFARTLLDDADAAAARVTLGTGPVPAAFQAFGGNETNGLGVANASRQSVDFVAVGPRMLAHGSCALSAMTSNNAYAYASMRIYDVATGLAVVDTTESIIGIVPDAAGGFQTAARSIAANGLTTGKLYRAQLWLRSNFDNYVRPQGLLISGISL